MADLTAHSFSPSTTGSEKQFSSELMIRRFVGVVKKRGKSWSEKPALRNTFRSAGSVRGLEHPELPGWSPDPSQVLLACLSAGVGENVYQLLKRD